MYYVCKYTYVFHVILETPFTFAPLELAPQTLEPGAETPEVLSTFLKLVEGEF